MAEVYDPSNPYGSSGIEDPSNTGAFLDWQTAINMGLVPGGTPDGPWGFNGWDPNYAAGLGMGNPFTGVDPSNPYDTAPTGTYIGGIPGGLPFTGDIYSNPFTVDFGDKGGSSIVPFDGTSLNPNYGPGAATGDGFGSGHGSLDPNANPTQYPSGQFPNIGIGIPGLIGIGAGGLMTGGLWDILDGNSGGGGGGGQSGGGAIFPTVSGGSGATVGPGLGGQQGDPNAVMPLPGIYSDSGATVGPGLGGEQGDPTAILPPPGIFSDSGATVTSGSAEDTPTGPATIVPPGLPGPGPYPTEPTKPNMIVPGLPGTYTDSGLTVIPGGGGGGGGGGGDFGQPSQLPTQQVSMDQPLNRNYYNEGRQGLIDLNALMPYMADLYKNTAQQYTNADFARYQGLLGRLGQSNQTLSNMAADQTRYANTQLRSGNLQDVGAYGQQALALRQGTNQELYGNLNRLDAAAGQQAGAGGQNFLNSLLGQGGLQPSSIQTTLEQQAAQGLAQGRNLSADDVRMAQQAAREGSAARGRLGDQSSIAAEVLNRDALARQRENERRAFAQSVDQAGFGQRAAGLQGNIGLGQAVGGMDLARQQQSFNQLLGATQARTANAFDPFGTILGAQYGMQTSNVGNNQQLFNNATGFSSGAYGNQYVQNAYNPYNNYAADVYGSNFNAANARQIAANTSGAYNDAARNNLYSQILGGAINYLLPQLGPNVNKPTGGTGTGKG